MQRRLPSLKVECRAGADSHCRKCATRTLRPDSAGTLPVKSMFGDERALTTVFRRECRETCDYFIVGDDSFAFCHDRRSLIGSKVGR